MLTVVAAGLQTLVVDAGRAGWAHLGVPRSGALDPQALSRANLLVGNPEGAAGLECLLRGPVLSAPGRRLAAVAPGVELVADDELDLRRLPCLRVWLGVAGGIDVAPVLGSRSADLLGGLGPPPLGDGQVLPLGRAVAPLGPDPAGALPLPATGPLRLLAGPDAVPLAEGPWRVLPASDRTALRLDGPAAPQAVPATTRGLVPGAVQVPPDGRPVIFLAGHPATGGYPLAGFIRRADLGRLAQLRPGDEVGISRPEPARRASPGGRVRRAR